MEDAAPQTIYLADYRPFGWIVEGVELTFRLSPEATRVLSRIRFAPNPEATGQEFFLHGEEVRLISARIDGQAVVPAVTPLGLTCAVPPGPFLWEAEVEIAPARNTALEGLYMSNGMYCTQCEAEGFRKITFYPDRPDVMAPFKVRIESDLPVLLSNGNPAGQGAGWAEWDDPWPKPAYLFALVAGDLVAHRDHFTTRSGRKVDLAVWVRPGDQDRCAYAMDSLIRSMKWDEDVYGREYDLDIFNIVAVDDFNMGAMENKGLNIFNSKLVLASPETATDDDYGRIEGVIAHEYFHNWTGNRITCRDWFQLCLKEGLTVFRDQQFSGDMRSHAVKRIEDVALLRARQFREDQGPLAHPVRPESFVEINNFYTATVYEKGAEVIGMLKTLVGDDGYARALDLYFDRHDGDAATIEDWLKVFEDATGRDLTQFKRWYSQAGTPRLKVSDDWVPDVKGGTYTLHFEQENPPTPGQPQKDPRVIPIAVGLLNPNGDEVVPTTVLELTEGRQSFRFEGLAAKPVPSILRGFSAPVNLTLNLSDRDLEFLMVHDSDLFNRWQAANTFATRTLVEMVKALKKGERSTQRATVLARALGAAAGDASLEPAYRAELLKLPSQADIARTIGRNVDPGLIFRAHRQLGKLVGAALGPMLEELYAEMAPSGAFSPDAKSAGRRSLRNAALTLLSARGTAEDAARLSAHFFKAGNMTDEQHALLLLATGSHPDREKALERFHDRWKGDNLVIDTWFAAQAQNPQRSALAQVRALTRHPLFTLATPNKVRALIGTFAMQNPVQFHRPDGAGYEFLAKQVLALDRLNPQIAARMLGAFRTWHQLEAERRGAARKVLESLVKSPNLSRDAFEIATKMLD